MAKKKVSADPEVKGNTTEKMADKIIAELMADDHCTLASEVDNSTQRIFFPSPSLNYIYGGLVKGRIHRLHGPESSGKSSLAIFEAAVAQQQEPNPAKKWVFYFDFEQTFDAEFATNIGLDVSKTIVCTDACVEDAALKFFKALPILCAAIFDSDAAASSRTEFQEEIGKPSFGGLAKIIGAFCRRANNLCAEYKVPLIMISQERANSQPMGYLPSVTGGYALRFFASTRCRCQNAGYITDKSGDNIGIQIKIKCYKNKTGIVGRSKILNFYFNGGFDVDAEYADMIFQMKIFEQHGAYYSNDTFGVKFQGKTAVMDWLKANPDKYEECKKLVNERLMHASFVAEDDTDRSISRDEDDVAEEAESSKVLENSNPEALAQLALEASEGGE